MYTVREHGTLSFGPGELGRADEARLAGLAERGTVLKSFALLREGARLKAGDVVGAVELDCGRLVIQPKFAVSGPQLVAWLCYVLGRPMIETDLPARPSAGPTGLLCDAIVRALVEECRSLLRVGLRRDYVRQRAVESSVRGRIDVTAQATRRFGLLNGFHLHTVDRVAEVWENELCGAALAAAAGVAQDPALARDAADLAGCFPRPARPAALADRLPRLGYSRINQHYRPPHVWARVLLQRGGIDDLLIDAGYEAAGVLLAMDRLWERLVRRLTAQAAEPLGGRIVASQESDALRIHSDLGPHTFRPDCLVRIDDSDAVSGQRMLLPVDAKYKRYEDRAITADDSHQLLTYACGYRSAAGAAVLLVHPSNGASAARVLNVAGPGGVLGTIYVLGLDVSSPPGDGVAPIRSILDRMAKP